MGSPILYLVACAVCLGAGIYLGLPSEVAPEDERADKSRSRPGETVAGSWSPPDTAGPADLKDRKMILQRSISACETEALWQWLASQPKNQELARDLVLNELIDRLGWGAWEHVRGLESGKSRDLVGESILMRLAERDPWKAHEEWQQHRGEFDHEIWGFGVIAECTKAAAEMSADQVLKVFGSIPRQEANESMYVEYAADFDFRKVLDHLATGGPQPYTMTEDLLSSWAGREPEEAAAWLGSHPEYLEREYQASEAGEMLSNLARMKMGDETRERVLRHFSGLPQELVDRAWLNISTGTRGTLSEEVLRSADLMNKRGVYLENALLDTRALEALDDSWDAVPLPERRELLDKVEQHWVKQRNSAVEMKARNNWREMVEQAWGLR